MSAQDRHNPLPSQSRPTDRPDAHCPDCPFSDRGDFLVYRDEWDALNQDRIENRRLREALIRYANHQSWRCEHAPHFYLADSAASQAIVDRDDCYCGLKKTLRDLGVES